jgi:gamma-glutamyltranspeptidase/glutathione hydrolase
MKDGGTVYLERGYPLETVNALKQRRHRVGVEMGGYGGYQAIMRDDEQGVYYGASESRKDGHAAGY